MQPFDSLVLSTIFSFLSAKNYLLQTCLVCKDWNFSNNSLMNRTNKIPLPIIELNLSNRKIYDEKLEKLIDENLDRYDWSNLQQLNLERNIIGSLDCLMEDKRSLRLNNLRILKLTDNQIDQNLSRLFSSVEKWIYLKELYLGKNFITKIIVKTQFPALEVLELSNNAIENNGVDSLLTEALVKFPKLRKLLLTNIRMKSFDPLIKNCQNLPNLKCLDISYNSFYEKNTLGNLNNFPLLEELFAAKCSFKVLDFILTSSIDSSLITLDLSDCGLGDLLSDLNMGDFKKLKKLILSSNDIGNDEVLMLEKLEAPNLTHLNLDENVIGLEGANHLANLTNFPQLEYLSCHNHSSDKHKNFESYSLNNFLEDCREELGEELEEEEEQHELDYYGGIRNAKGKEISFVSSVVSFTWLKSEFVYVYH